MLTYLLQLWSSIDNKPVCVVFVVDKDTITAHQLAAVIAVQLEVFILVLTAVHLLCN